MLHLRPRSISPQAAGVWPWQRAPAAFRDGNCQQLRAPDGGCRRHLSRAGWHTQCRRSRGHPPSFVGGDASSRARGDTMPGSNAEGQRNPQVPDHPTQACVDSGRAMMCTNKPEHDSQGTEGPNVPCISGGVYHPFHHSSFHLHAKPPKQRPELVRYSCSRARGGGISVTIMPSKSLRNKEATPLLAPDGCSSGTHLGLTGPANEVSVGLATEVEDDVGSTAAEDGCAGRDWHTVSQAKSPRPTRAAMPGSPPHRAKSKPSATARPASLNAPA